MPKAPKPVYFAVAKGKHAHSPGIYTDWNETAAHVLNCHSKCHKFTTLPEAYQFLSDNHADLSTIAGPSAAAAGPSSTTHSAPAAHTLSAFSAVSSRALFTPSAGTVSETNGRQEDTEASADEEHLWDILYTDGACSNNGNGAIALAGIGVWSAADERRRLSERCPGTQTNNRAELIAIIRALEETPYDGLQLLIKTDSRYAIDCGYTYIPEWQKNGRKKRGGKPAKNQELLEYLAALLELHDLRGHRVRLRHVRGHSGDAGNEAADALARAGALLAQRDEGDWAAKLQEVQDAVLIGTRSAHSPGSLKMVMRSAATPQGHSNPSPCELDAQAMDGDDDEFSSDDGEFMDDIDEDELARLDIPLAAQPAGVLAFVGDGSDFDGVEAPFADLTHEQLDALEVPRPAHA
ncbi:ribonuclease H-like protein [Auricularia subglabra TFB-10046 SS5]|nr:ribonuclease H-like protein [Auricularia subglabra TFB-10046 SS5]